MDIKIKLSTPIQAYGEQVTELTLREPRGKELVSAGCPIIVQTDDLTEGGATNTRFDMPVIARLISTLGQVPPSSVDQLVAADFMRAMWGILGFFGAAIPRGSPSSSSMSEGSGANSAS